MKHLASLSLLTALCAIGCPKAEPLQDDASATAGALAAVQERVKKVDTYELEGTYTDVASGTVQHFTYALRQPKRLVAHVKESGQTLAFDGVTLSILDPQSKVVLRQKLEGMADTQILAMTHQVFGQFVCEGWRPPLLRSDPKVLQGRVLPAARAGEAPSWLLVNKLEDTELAEVRYQLRAPRADFVLKETVDKAGKVVASTRVTAEHKDAATGFSFPQAWERTDATGTVKVELTKIVVNGDVAVDRFVVPVPEGYTEKDAATLVQGTTP